MTAGLRRRLASCIATVFWVGRFPLAPGTIGSLAALPVIWFLHAGLGALGVLGFAMIVLAAGVWAAQVHAEATGRVDPGEIVIDEVAGQAIAIAFLPIGIIEYSMAFILFRVFDIVKVWPARWVDQRVSGGVGIMLDDVIAGLYAGLASLALLKVIPT